MSTSTATVAVRSPELPQFERGSFLERLREKDREELFEISRRRVVTRMTTICAEGDLPSRALILLSGLVKLAQHTDEGREIILAVRGPGDLITEGHGYDLTPSESAASAITDIEILPIPNDLWRNYLRTHPGALEALLTILVGRIKASERNRVELVMSDTVGRVAQRIIEMADRFGDPTDGSPVRLAMPVTQQELAAWAGASREATSRALHTLRSRQMIDVNRRQIVVLDRARLMARASGRLWV